MFQLCRKLHNITFEKRLYDAKRSNGSANACKKPDAVSFFFFNTNVTTLKSRGLYIKTKKKKKKERKITKDAMTVSSSENQAISF